MWRLSGIFKEQVHSRLETLYPGYNVERLLERIALIAARYSFLEDQCGGIDSCWDEKSCLLITYGDMVSREREAPLVTLHRFLQERLVRVFAGVHILPFFPYSSDDGFSVIDYRQVDPALGTWEDIERIGGEFRLMTDLVLNHVSSQSKWYEEYISGIAPARDYFIEVEPETDLSAVVRPRTSPLLSPAYTVSGKRQVWTTFSADQVDLNLANPNVLLELLDILLGYIVHGTRIVRLDAVAYLWKEIGTPCINLPQTHEIVKLMRLVVDNATPGTILLTETNLPHDQNVSYFGDGDEAHLVYQFSLPPLLLHTLHSGSAGHLRQWASDLAPPPVGCSFLNFTASHDGIGVRPLEGLLSDEEIGRVVQRVVDCGGLVSSRQAEDGAEQPYELNITWFDAMADSGRLDDMDWQIRRFLCSQIIMLSLRGIPAIYFHSLTATRNNHDGVAETGQNRTINRGRWHDDELRSLLDQEDSTTARVFHAYINLLAARREHPAFHPDAPQQVLELSDALFGVVRTAADYGRVICLHNVSPEEQHVSLDSLAEELMGHESAHDLISGSRVKDKVVLAPYQCYWLTLEDWMEK